MAKNRVYGNNNGVQAGTVHGNVTFRGGRVNLDATTGDDGDDVVNEVYGDNNGLQVGNVHGDLNFG